VESGTGKLSILHTTAGIINPSFLALSPDSRFLYAVSETDSLFPDRFHRGSGGVASYAVNAETGTLEFINMVPSHGTYPCHVSVHPSGRFIFIANYISGSVSVLPVSDEGSLEETSCVIRHEGNSIDPVRQEGPHAHSVTLTPDGGRLVAADLGLDRLILYSIDTTRGSLKEAGGLRLLPGSGPRHTAFHPRGDWGVVINELSSTITAFSYNRRKGTLQTLGELSALPADYSTDSFCSEVRFTSSGGRLYGANRGHDSIVCLEAGDEPGALSVRTYTPTQGRTPRHFTLTPDEKLLFAANQDSSTVISYRVEPETWGLGFLQLTDIPSPVCLLCYPHAGGVE
jgi:6-phosphogluconolactonase